MKYSISQSARIVQVTRKTFYSHIKKKGITIEKDDDGKVWVDHSELIRVYGDKCNFENAEGQKSRGDVQDVSKETDVSSNIHLDYAILKSELAFKSDQLREAKENYEEQIDFLRNQLAEASNEKNKLTALLTDQSNSSDWQRALKGLEARIANQEQVNKEQKDKEARILKQNKHLKKALQAERSKGFFQRLFRSRVGGVS